MKKLLLAALLLHSSIVPGGWDYMKPNAVMGCCVTIVGSLFLALSASITKDAKDTSKTLPLLFFSVAVLVGGLSCCIGSILRTRCALQEKMRENSPA